MKWPDRFQIASGVNHARTKNNAPYVITHFRNGDDLVVFKDTQQYFLLYADSDTPDQCYVKDTFTYDILDLPRLHKWNSASR